MGPASLIGVLWGAELLILGRELGLLAWRPRGTSVHSGHSLALAWEASEEQLLCGSVHSQGGGSHGRVLWHHSSDQHRAPSATTWKCQPQPACS